MALGSTTFSSLSKGQGFIPSSGKDFWVDDKIIVKCFRSERSRWPELAAHTAGKKSLLPGMNKDGSYSQSTQRG